MIVEVWSKEGDVIETRAPVRRDKQVAAENTRCMDVINFVLIVSSSLYNNTWKKNVLV